MCRTPFIKPDGSAPQAPPQDADVDVGEFDAALARVLAAYQAERERISAAPHGAFTDPSEHPYASAEYDNDRSEFSGMYS
jgi:hypothetical protein